MDKNESAERTKEIVRLYEIEQLSLKKVAKQLKISRQTVAARLVGAGVKLRPKRWEVLKTLDRSDLVKLYVEDRLSVFDVAKRLGTAWTVVVREMERFGIERRPKYGQPKVLRTFERADLVRLYVDERRTPSAIAKILNAGLNTVIRELDRFGIERRPKYTGNRRPMDEKIAEIVRLYEVEQLSMKQIAKELNVTRQAIHYRLVQAGIKFRPKRHEVRKTIDQADLIRLYVEEGLAVSAVARRLNLDQKIVVRELERFSIERRPKYSEKRIPTPLDNLKVGESALMIYAEKKQYTPIHKLASVRKMKVSVKRVDSDHVRVTRTK